MESLHGVNLGGWLVLERWISPSLFVGTTSRDEYSLCRELGAEASRRITDHRESFITEDHIRHLAERGINCLRLPLGYWLFGAQPPFVDGADTYVERLFKWADSYNLAVILDFHAAPGSQNGNDHSAQAGAINWPQPQNINRSLEFIDQLTQRYGHQPRLVGVEALNEPDWSIGPAKLLDFYTRADKIIRTNCQAGVMTIVHDAFRPLEMSAELDSHGLNVALDVHLYQLYTPEDRSLNLKGHIKKTKREWKPLLKGLAKSRPLLVGEWSAAMHELYLDIEQPSWNYTNSDYRKYFNIQKRIFSKAKVGWMYWTARVEGGGPWSLMDQSDWAV